MFTVQKIRDDFIIPAIQTLGLHGVVRLLLGTCAQESHLGKYTHQINGPALGIFQIEPNTVKLIRSWIKKNKPELEKKLLSLSMDNRDELWNVQYNHKYSAALARILYYSIPAPLPDENSVYAMATYYKKYYNRCGKATVEEFIENYKKLVLPYL
jgi:hypothetical protein